MDAIVQTRRSTVLADARASRRPIVRIGEEGPSSATLQKAGTIAILASAAAVWLFAGAF